MMTRKTYEAVAKAISGLEKRGSHPANGGTLVLKAEVMYELGKIFAADNPKFNYTRFLTACVAGQEVVEEKVK